MPRIPAAVCLALTLVLAAAPSAQDAWVGFDVARTLLEQAMIQQREPEQWGDVRDTAALARQSLQEVDAALDPELHAAIGATLDAVVARQDAVEQRWTSRSQAQAENAGDEQLLASTFASIDMRWTTTATKIAEGLLGYAGQLPETHVLASELFFDASMDTDGTDALRRGLVRWPDSALLHEQLRAWTHRITNTEGFMVAFEQRVDALGARSPYASGLALESSAALYEELGHRAYGVAQASSDPAAYADAARYFEAAARDVRRSRSMSREMPADEIDAQRAQALINAGWAHYAIAQRAWFDEGRDSETAWAAAGAAQSDFVDALRAEPANRAAQVALTTLGTLVGTKAQDIDPLSLGPEDMADIRDYFGDLAPYFEIAEWWNNFALFSRDTGVQAAASGDEERAMELWEQSYAAYEKAIALDPSDARMTNDTGLMLLYHLDRDLDRAEELFLRAWELGEAACNNPFADPESDSWQTDFGGYTDAMLNLALLYARRGDLDRASEVIDELVALSPERLDARALKGQIDTAKAQRDP